MSLSSYFRSHFLPLSMRQETIFTIHLGYGEVELRQRQIFVNSAQLKFESHEI